MANSAVKYLYDAATAFRGTEAEAVTATGNTDTVALDRITKGRGDVNNTVGAQSHTVVVTVTDLDTANADETYQLEVKTDNDVVIATVAVDQVGAYALPFDTDTVEKLDPGYAALYITHTLAGTTPSLTYAAWLHRTIR